MPTPDSATTDRHRTAGALLGLPLLALVLLVVLSSSARAATATAGGTPTGTATSTAAAPAGSAQPGRSGSLTATPAGSAQPSRSGSLTATPTPRPTPTRTQTALPTPSVVRAKIEIVWPHDGAGVRDAALANVTAYLLAGDGSGPAATSLDPPPCNWRPTVRLWAALNARPAEAVAVGQQRIISKGGRTFQAWDFNDIDVSAAQDPANKLMFFVTVDGAETIHNVWSHAVDGRTIFPQQEVPVAAVRRRPEAVDARIQIVWPQGNLPVDQATRANITAYLFMPGTQQALAPEISWSPTVRLHWALNNDSGPDGASGLVGTRRVATTAAGLRFLAWDFNDVDVSVARDPLNRLYFWVSVDGVTTYTNIWAHGADARTLFPQPDVPNSCR